RGDTFAAYFHPFFGLWHSTEQDRRNELAFDNAALANEIAEAQRDADTGKALLGRDDAEHKLVAVRDALAAYQEARSDAGRSRLTQAIAAAQDSARTVASLEKAAQADIE